MLALAGLVITGLASPARGQSFTAVGTPPGWTVSTTGDTISYAVSGTFVGTVILEESLGIGSAAWTTVVTASVPATGSFRAEPPSGSTAGVTLRYRFRCSAYTSGTIVAAVSSGSGAGAGTPGGADTEIQFNHADSFDGAAGITYDPVTQSTEFIATAGAGNGVAMLYPDNTDQEDPIGLRVDTSTSNTSGNPGDIIGVLGRVTTSGAGGTADRLIGGEFAVSDTVGRTTTDAIALHSVLGLSGTLTTAYGLKVEDVAGAQTNYAVRTGTGLVSFGDAISTGGTAPAVANVGANSCGTTAATVVGNDNAGTITVGATSGSQCRIAFVRAAPTRRECTVTDETTTIATRAAYVDTTHTDFLGVFGAGDLVSYVCFAR